MGSNVSINNNLLPALVYPTSAGGGSIDVSGSKIALNRGAIFFEAIGSGNSVSLAGDQRQDLVLFTTASQVLTGTVGGDEQTVITGSRGTTLSNETDRVVLHVGRVLAGTTENLARSKHRLAL